MKTVYLAGPMRSVPLFNFPAFFTAAGKLSREGFHVINPAEHDRDELGLNPEDFPNGQFEDAGWSAERIRHFMRQAFAWDVAAILRSDAIAMLPGWENSKGAKAELGVADMLNLEVIYL